ncbi:MAG: aldehyde ferredoxin oxidoreductase family protein [Deltaproteobacteria bacterium]|nr:aldehyde ferredoxin oxidoreductase family protein [Deltaproteobacteria bacterium]
MYGFYGRILFVDLSRKRFRVEAPDEKVLSGVLGGKGLASHLLLTLNPPMVDPLSPENHLIFSTGPACGSLVWGSSRYGVFTKSPQTGFYSESYAGGRVPEAMDAAGYDAIVIEGKSNTPAVLVVDPHGVVFHDAGDLWGMDTHQSEDEAIKRFAKKKTDRRFRAGAVVIGPAGEHQVCFSVIENDYWRSAGRTGAGSIMGSKGLKAIVFQGDRRRKLADRKAVQAFAKDFAKDSKEHPQVAAYKSKGTPMLVKVMNEVGGFPTRYWSEGTYEKWPQISADALHDRCEVKPRACLKCFMACGRMTRVRSGRHAGLRLEGPEYETIYAFGGLCLIDNIEEIIYLNDICDRLGIDTITAGNLCGLTIEAARRGRIDIAIDYGDVDAIAGLLKKIAFRQGIGDLLARGIKAASEEWGLQDLAVHVKGLEPAGYDPRVLKGVGLGYATSDRGACHLRATFYKAELSGMIDPDTIEGKAAMFVDFEDRLTLFDALILCRFFRDLYPWEALCETVQGLTGIETSTTGLKAISANISNIVRRFNIQEGLRREDDRLPIRLHKEALKSGHQISEVELETMVTEYYLLRGWDAQGKPR